MLFTRLVHSMCAFSVPFLHTTTARVVPIQDVTRTVDSDLPRLVIYFQTTHNATTNDTISMLPLITEHHISVTHLLISTFHLSGPVDEIRLNDFRADHPRFYTLWNETLIMQKAGVKVMGTIGGEARGAFNEQHLDSPDETTFELHYGRLAGAIRQYKLQGMDLDVEERMSQYGITRLVIRLNADFGDDFIISMSPVPEALYESDNISGFDYWELDWITTTVIGKPMIDFMNGQFYYSGVGRGMANTQEFDRVIDHGWDPARIVTSQMTYGHFWDGFCVNSSRLFGTAGRKGLGLALRQVCRSGFTRPLTFNNPTTNQITTYTAKPLSIYNITCILTN